MTKLADGLHVRCQRALFRQQKQLRLRLYTRQGDAAAAVDDGQGAHAERARAGTLELEHKVARLPVLQCCQAGGKQLARDAG